MGNDLKIGDYIAVSDKTYSKTPYIIYGQITNIEYEYTKSGDWSCTNIDYKFIIYLLVVKIHILRDIDQTILLTRITYKNVYTLIIHNY